MKIKSVGLRILQLWRNRRKQHPPASSGNCFCQPVYHRPCIGAGRLRNYLHRLGQYYELPCSCERVFPLRTCRTGYPEYDRYQLRYPKQPQITAIGITHIDSITGSYVTYDYQLPQNWLPGYLKQPVFRQIKNTAAQNWAAAVYVLFWKQVCHRYTVGLSAALAAASVFLTASAL